MLADKVMHMPMHARKVVVYAIIAALAGANGFTPRHVQAAVHDRVQSGTTAGHHHGAAAADLAADHAGAVRCHDEGQPDRATAFPDSNCCVASCSASAFIFATFAFDQSLPRETYLLPPARALTPAAPIGDDPPPR